MWGQRDAFVAPRFEERRRLLARFQADLDFRLVDGAGHWVIYEAAERVNAMLLEMRSHTEVFERTRHGD